MKVIGTHHVAILSENFEEVEQFYCETLGFPVSRRWPDAGIVFIDVGSTTIELIDKEQDQRDRGARGGFDHLALQVEDVDEACQELAKSGIKITDGPRDFNQVRIAFFADPDGNVLELVEERS